MVEYRLKSQFSIIHSSERTWAQCSGSRVCPSCTRRERAAGPAQCSADMRATCATAAGKCSHRSSRAVRIQVAAPSSPEDLQYISKRYSNKSFIARGNQQEIQHVRVDTHINHKYSIRPDSDRRSIEE